MVKFLMSVLNWPVNSCSNFTSFFIVMTHKSPVNFKLIHFLLSIKGPNKSLNFSTFKRALVKICQNPFLQNLHDSLVSWKITPQYFFRSKITYFAQKGPIKVQIFNTFECSDQNLPNSCQFWNNKWTCSKNIGRIVNIPIVSYFFVIWFVSITYLKS